MEQSNTPDKNDNTANPPTQKANKWLLIVGWICALSISLIGAVIGHLIQNNASYDESTRNQGKAIRYTAYVVFVISIIFVKIINS